MFKAKDPFDQAVLGVLSVSFAALVLGAGFMGITGPRNAGDAPAEMASAETSTDAAEMTDTAEAEAPAEEETQTAEAAPAEEDSTDTADAPAEDTTETAEADAAEDPVQRRHVRGGVGRARFREACFGGAGGAGRGRGAGGHDCGSALGRAGRPPSGATMRACRRRVNHAPA